jgi:hypothetical protein
LQYFAHCSSFQRAISNQFIISYYSFVQPTTASPTAANDGGITIPTREELWTIQKAKWDTFLTTQSPNNNGYEMVYQKTCFCIPDMILPYRVSVNKDGVISNIKHANSANTPAENSIVIANMLTVERAFQVIQEAWSAAANVVNVIYDEEYGHPTYVYIDKSARMRDEEYSFTIQNVTIIG